LTVTGRHARLRALGPLGKAVLAVAVVAGLGAAALSAAALLRDDGQPVSANSPMAAVPVYPTASSPAASAAAPSASAAAPPSASAAALRPVSLSIPAIGVHTTLQDLGLDASGALKPPTSLSEAGWYTGSAVPGQTGPAVVAGHVDSRTGPAVFFKLRDLAPGDGVAITLSSGATARFTVTEVERYPKDAFPTAAVYGARPDPELRLITCGGSFADGHYEDNVVVYATLAAVTA
jgi:sortase (surface protein transpeptidase)